jgi:uncharacterized protein (DUF2267 family)
LQARTIFSRVGIEADLETLAQARRATAAVLQALRDRLTPDEARQAAAQLPRELKAMWRQGDRADRRPLKLHRQEFYERVRRQADLASLRQAAVVTDAVFAALKDQISGGEADDILAQLPRDLKTVWVRA